MSEGEDMRGGSEGNGSGGTVAEEDLCGRHAVYECDVNWVLSSACASYLPHV